MSYSCSDGWTSSETMLRWAIDPPLTPTLASGCERPTRAWTSTARPFNVNCTHSRSGCGGKENVMGSLDRVLSRADRNEYELDIRASNVRHMHAAARILGGIDENTLEARPNCGHPPSPDLNNRDAVSATSCYTYSVRCSDGEDSARRRLGNRSNSVRRHPPEGAGLHRRDVW